jgi:hypothetical protein
MQDLDERVAEPEGKEDALALLTVLERQEARR